MFASCMHLTVPHVNFQALEYTTWKRNRFIISSRKDPQVANSITEYQTYTHPSQGISLERLLVAGIISYSKFQGERCMQKGYDPELEAKQIQSDSALSSGRPCPIICNILIRSGHQMPVFFSILLESWNLSRKATSAGCSKRLGTTTSRWLIAAGKRLQHRCHFFHELTCASIRRIWRLVSTPPCWRRGEIQNQFLNPYEDKKILMRM